MAAPLRETLAAALVDIAGYRGRGDLCDPFCGSGTIAIEAALAAKGIGDSDDAADYLPDAIVRVDYVGGIPQGWVEGLTVAAVACLIYAIVVLIRILCGKYDEVKLPDITFELVDMTPETGTGSPEAKPEEETPAARRNAGGTPETPAETRKI